MIKSSHAAAAARITIIEAQAKLNESISIDKFRKGNSEDQKVKTIFHNLLYVELYNTYVLKPDEIDSIINEILEKLFQARKTIVDINGIVYFIKTYKQSFNERFAVKGFNMIQYKRQYHPKVLRIFNAMGFSEKTAARLASKLIKVFTDRGENITTDNYEEVVVRTSLVVALTEVVSAAGLPSLDGIDQNTIEQKLLDMSGFPDHAV